MENEENVELEEVNEVDTSEDEVETTNEQVNTKTYSEEELQSKLEELRTKMKEENQNAWNKRWGQEKSKMEREFAKQSELTNLLLKQTGQKNVDDLLNMSYEEYGVERPSTPSNIRDEERLGKLDAQELFDLDDAMIEEEANRLAGMKRTVREEATFMELSRHLTEKKAEAKRKQEIKESGIDESLLESQEFKDFANKFNENASLKDIFEIFSKTKTEPKKKPFSAGSANGKSIKETSEYFTPDEFEALTESDFNDPKIYEKAMKTIAYYNK